MKRTLISLLLDEELGIGLERVMLAAQGLDSTVLLARERG
jgi:hypothetical protein